jgi:two-component system, NtrC family, sensor kinase
MSRKKRRDKTAAVQIGSLDEKKLQVLIVGHRDAIENALEILEDVSPIRRNLNLIGVACVGECDMADLPAAPEGVPVFDNFEEVIAQHPPDLVVLTVDDRDILMRLLTLLPKQSRVLDNYCMQTCSTLNRVFRRLGTTERRVRDLELIKDVLTSGSSVSVIIVDEDYKVVDIDYEIPNRLKMAREGCLGRGCYWVIHRRMEACHVRGGDCPAAEVLATGRSTHKVSVEPREDGGRRYFTVSAYPLGVDDRGKKCVLIVWKDVTKGLTPLFDRQVQTLKASFSRMLHEDRMAALGKLAAAAVHEINNPLQGILTFSKLMRSALDAPSLEPEVVDKFRTYLDLISGESARCGKILKSLLSFARLDTLERKSFDLDPVVDELMLLISNRMELQGVTFQRKVPTPFMVQGDRNQIKQMLLNLSLNGIEAMPEGGELTIAASLSAIGNHVKISVMDTGRGIDRAVRENMLEPFVTTKAEGRGVGLGLSMVYGIVTQHGGSIEIQSEANRGATFVVSLPRTQPSDQDQ